MNNRDPFAYDWESEHNRLNVLGVTDDSGQRLGIVPLVTERGSTEGGQSVAAGPSSLQFSLPEGVKPSELKDEHLQPRFLLANDQEATVLDATWRRYVAWMDQSGAPWVTPGDAQRFAEAIGQASRGGALPQVLDAEDLLGEGWYASEIRNEEG